MEQETIVSRLKNIKNDTLLIKKGEKNYAHIANCVAVAIQELIDDIQMDEQ